MGKTDNKNIDGNGTTPSSTNDTDTETTGSAESKRGRGRPRKSEQPATEREAASNIPRLVLVDEPGIEDDGPQPQTKKSSSTRKRKDVNIEIKKDQISVLIKTTFDIMAARPGFEIWKLSQNESELIAEPLAQVMNKNPFISGAASKYGDYIALIVALASVIIPRLFVQMAAQKDKNKNEVTPYVPITKIDGKQNKEQPARNQQQSGTPGNSAKQLNREPAPARPIPGQELHNIIPAIQ